MPENNQPTQILSFSISGVDLEIFMAVFTMLSKEPRSLQIEEHLQQRMKRYADRLATPIWEGVGPVMVRMQYGRSTETASDTRISFDVELMLYPTPDGAIAISATFQHIQNINQQYLESTIAVAAELIKNKQPISSNDDSVMVGVLNGIWEEAYSWAEYQDWLKETHSESSGV